MAKFIGIVIPITKANGVLIGSRSLNKFLVKLDMEAITLIPTFLSGNQVVGEVDHTVQVNINAVPTSLKVEPVVVPVEEVVPAEAAVPVVEVQDMDNSISLDLAEVVVAVDQVDQVVEIMVIALDKVELAEPVAKVEPVEPVAKEVTGVRTEAPETLEQQVILETQDPQGLTATQAPAVEELPVVVDQVDLAVLEEAQPLITFKTVTT